MRRERHEKSVHLPVRVRNGQIEFLLAPGFPPLKNGRSGHIVLDAEAIDDPRWKAFLTADKDVLLAPAHSVVVFRVAWNKGADAPALISHLLDNEWFYLLQKCKPPADAILNEPHRVFNFSFDFGVEAVLTEPLFLRLRSCKSAQLRGGQPSVPALAKLQQNDTFGSLNQALTQISRTFEPQRHGNTGDTFRDVLLLQNDKWCLLDDLRLQYETMWERELSREFDFESDVIERWRLGGLFALSVEEES